jgi:hypothetical protein
MKTTEIGRLRRDPSMVSRLCGTYETARDPRVERKIASALDKQLTTQARPLFLPKFAKANRA